MIQTDKQQMDSMEIEASRATAPEAYLISFMNCISLCDQVFKDLQGNTDFRPYFMVRQLISRIPEDSIRLALFERIDAEMERIEKLSISNEDKGKLRLMTAQAFQGEAVAYFDQYVGISRKQIIGQV